ncbi:phosphoribosylformylglycinamidine synthase I [Candidatus Gracilibacteria bacterium]|nr:phosphoribosylformylglycinamidine synthase I [Candidatus Gracilibacteria bacterium]
MTPKLAVVAFPGNNCESESLRAAKRNGFDTDLILWNEIEKIGHHDAYFLPGGFSFEDRGRSGVIASREPIFAVLRKEAQKGKVILGVCNGAQMIVESGLIPVEDNPVPFALAENVRRDETGKVLGTGFYNSWKRLKPARRDTAFTNSVNKDFLRLPMAHGEGRFTSTNPACLEALKSDNHVAFRYCDNKGNVSDKFPITPNGSNFAVAMIVNKEGTIGAIMPHPERFYDSCDGDQIFQSMRQWIEEKRSPEEVMIGDFSQGQLPEIKNFQVKPNSLLLEKKLIITDNEGFSISQTASNIAGEEIKLGRSILYEIYCDRSEKEKIIDSGLILNPNKEQLLDFTENKEAKYAVLPLEDDAAKALGEKLSKLLNKDVEVKIYKCWDFGDTNKESVNRVIQNRLLANPNSAEVVKT